jgi:hypothetical protein
MTMLVIDKYRRCGIIGAVWRKTDFFVTRILLSRDTGRPYKCSGEYSLHFLAIRVIGS